MSPATEQWGRISAAFADGRTFTTSDAAEVIRPVVNPMVAVRTAMKQRRSPEERLTTISYRSRTRDDVSAGLHCIAGTLISNRRGYRGNRPLVKMVGLGQYVLITETVTE